MNEMDFMSAMVGGVPLFWLVMALVTFLGRFGVQGRAQLLAALITGVVLGAAYQALLRPLTDWAAWMGAIVYGLALGLTASGVYETAKKVTHQNE